MDANVCQHCGVEHVHSSSVTGLAAIRAGAATLPDPTRPARIAALDDDLADLAIAALAARHGISTDEAARRLAEKGQTHV